MEASIENNKNNINNNYENVVKKSEAFEMYSIHLKKKDGEIYTVIENFNEKLKDNSKYRIAFLKKSKKKKSGNEWRVPMFNKNSPKNNYYYNNDEVALSIPLGDWSITGSSTKNPSINNLPCIAMRSKKNLRQIKYIPISVGGEIEYITNTTYIFKNSSNKKLHIGYAIFKFDENKNRWDRVSNIAKIDLYAYDIGKKDKFFINII